MIGILVATYGGIGRSLLETAVDGRAACPVGDNGHAERRHGPSDGLGTVLAAADADRGEGVLILVDMFGSTSSTLALVFLPTEMSRSSPESTSRWSSAPCSTARHDPENLSEDVICRRRNVSTGHMARCRGRRTGNEP